MKKIRAVLISAGVMTVVSLLLLALISLAVAKSGSLPRGILPIITTAAACIAVFLGGFFSSLSAREKGILFGILSGLLFALCAALVSVFLYQNDFTIGSAGKLAALLISGSIGGILGVNRKNKVKF